MNTSPEKVLQLKLSATDQCVLCGICSTNCPTYQLNPIEAESPRGRIAIIQAYAQQSLKPSKIAFQHISHCTGCNQCQNICPSKVPFESIIDSFKALNKQPDNILIRILLMLTSQPGGLNRFHKSLRIYKKSGLQNIAQKLLNAFSLGHTHQRLSFIQSQKTQTSDSLTNAPSVALFSGCSGHLFDQQTLNNSLYLLQHLGINAAIPKNQFCCGALHQHNGRPDLANHLIKKNTDYFIQQSVDTIIFSASACQRQLKQSLNTPRLQCTDIITFIAPLLTINNKFKALNCMVYIHTSCNTNKETTAITIQLLKMIPGINIKDIGQNKCCGAGGSNQLQYPELSNALLADRIERIESSQPRYLLSDNLGCSLHYKSQLASHGINLDVIHPVTLIARQLCPRFE